MLICVVASDPVLFLLVDAQFREVPVHGSLVYRF